MRSILSLAVVFLTVQVKASQTVCSIKQENLASFNLAQELGVAVQRVRVIGLKNEIWQELTDTNIIKNTITVKSPNSLSRDLVIKSYVVSSKQIGPNGDCSILGIEENQN